MQKLVKQFQEDPIRITEIAEIESLKQTFSLKQRFDFVCKKCRNISCARLENFCRKSLICTRCAKKEAWTKHTELDRHFIQRKKEQTMKEHYGADFKEKINKKRKETFAAKTEQDWAEKLEKQKKTCQKKWGVDNPGAAKVNREKAKATCRKKYGTDFAAQQSSYQELRKEKCLKKYGVACVTQLSSFKKKRKASMQRKYGVDHPLQNPDINEKRMQTLEKRYGSRRTPGCRYMFENESFDSSWELAVWIWAKLTGKQIKREPCSFEYEFKNRKHSYIPDFEIDGKLIEVKGPQFFKEGKMINPYDNAENDFAEIKHLCGLDNGVEFWSTTQMQPILKIIRNKYGKNFKKKFKVEKKGSQV